MSKVSSNYSRESGKTPRRGTALPRPEESKIILGNQNEDAVNLLGYGDGILMTTYSSERIQALRIEGEEVLKVVEQAVALYGPPKFGASTEHPAPPDAPPTDSNNLTLERLRLEFAATLPCEEIPPPPADDEQITTASVDPDWEIFQKIKEGRKRQTLSDGKKTRKSPNKLCQEIFGLKSDGGNSMKAALKEYRRIRDKFAAVWIRELLEQEVGRHKIIEEIYNINTLKQSEYKKNNPTEWATINRVIQDIAQVLHAQPNPENE